MLGSIMAIGSLAGALLAARRKTPRLRVLLVDQLGGARDPNGFAYRCLAARRRANQPGGPNAGSVFANPDEAAAARLIDEAGLKGHRHGTAAVSTKHANFIQADEGGRADDVYALMGEIRAEVHARTGIELRIETRCLGFDDELNPRDEVEG